METSGITGNLLRSDCSGVHATKSGLQLAFKRSRAYGITA